MKLKLQNWTYPAPWEKILGLICKVFAFFTIHTVQMVNVICKKTPNHIGHNTILEN